MNITYKAINYEDINHCVILARWKNNIELQKIWLPNKKETNVVETYTAQEVQENSLEDPSDHPEHNFFILLDNNIIGCGSILIDPPMTTCKHLKVAWPATVIAAHEIRRQGIGQQTLEHIYKLARDQNATHIESAVFEFNKPCISFLKKNDFKEIARQDRVTYWDGQWWQGVRFLKEL